MFFAESSQGTSVYSVGFLDKPFPYGFSCWVGVSGSNTRRYELRALSARYLVHVYLHIPLFLFSLFLTSVWQVK